VGKIITGTIEFRYEELLECINTVCEEIEYNWYITPNKVFKLVSRDTTTPVDTITSTDDMIQYDIGKDARELVNRVIVVGAKTDDIPVIASAEDRDSIIKLGIKELVISAPEITDKSDAIRRAELELNIRKFERTRGTITIDGTTKYKLGDVVRLIVDEANIDANYIILKISQLFDDEGYTTELEVAGIVPEMQVLLKQLRKEVRGLATKEVKVTDLIKTISEEITTFIEWSRTTTTWAGTYKYDIARYNFVDYSWEKV